MQTKTIAITATLLAGLATACGGSTNGKLSRHVSNAHLAPVSAAERSGEAEARRDFFLAEWQTAFTEGQIRAAKLDVDIAKNELASAKLTVKNAKLERIAAEEGNDQNAIAKKTQAERVAHLNVEVRKLTIERTKQSKRYLERRLTHEQRSSLSKEAAIELARAQSLKSAGIAPPNFDPKKYKAQHLERVASAKQAKTSVDNEKAKLASLEKQLLGAKNAVAGAEGRPVVKPMPEESAPMAPLETERTPEAKTAEASEGKSTPATAEGGVSGDPSSGPGTPSETTKSQGSEAAASDDSSAPDSSAPDSSAPDSSASDSSASDSSASDSSASDSSAPEEPNS